MQQVVIKKFLCSMSLLFLFFIGSNKIQAKEVEATISLLELFSPNTTMENGIKGTVNSGGRIEIKIYDKSTNTISYRTETDILLSC